MPSVKRICGIPVALGLMIAGIFVLPAFGQEKGDDKTIGPFEGRVVDVAGKPVAGAAVWLIGGTYDDPQIVVETTSDKEGRFKIAKQPRKTSTPSERTISAMLAARDSTGRIGGAYNYYRNPFGDLAAKEFRIKLQNLKDCQGRLVDAAGQPVAKAIVEPSEWTTYPSREEPNQQIVYFPTSLRKKMTTETGPDGRFSFHNLPAVGNLGVKIRAEGFGEPRAGWKVEKSPTIQLGRVGSVQGSLACRRDPKAAAGVKLELEVDHQFQRVIEADQYIFYYANGETKQDGSFEFKNVPPGKYFVKPNLSETSPYYCEDANSVEVKSGEAANASLVLKQALKLQGKVVDRQTGEGVPGVCVMLYFDNPTGRRGNMKPATTDAKGAFTLYSPPGKGCMNLWQIPDRFLNPAAGRQQQNVEVKEDATLEPVRLERAKTLEGIVVDKSGKPVADAEIRCTDSDFSSSLQDVFHSDAAGKFTLKKIAPQKALVIRVRTKTAVAEPINVVPSELKEPLRVVVNEKTAFTMRGTALNDAGKPIPQADVALISHWSQARGGVSFQSHTDKTDDAGRFEFGGLWPGDRYQITVSARDCEKYGSPTVLALPGALHDLGKITIVALNGAVEGVVVDSSGKPLAGIGVFNSGDGLKRIDTITDEAGKFRIQGLRNGPVFVFAEKPGFRFAGARTKCGAAGVVLKMFRVEEPVPQRSTPKPRVDEERKMARKVLEKMLATGDDPYNQWARARIVKMDSEQNRHGTATESVDPHSSNDRPIEKVAEDDLEEALSLVPKQDDQAYSVLKGLANRFISQDREKAMRFAEEALLHSRNLDEPQRTAELAQIGALVARLGNKAAGRKLALEAADAAAKWKLTDQNRWLFSSVATAVASCDFDRAVALLEKFPKTSQRDRDLAQLAGSLDDVEKAESILKGMEPWIAKDARIHLACRIAAKRPAEAVRIVENLNAQANGYGDEEQAAAFGWIAVAIAPRDKKLAHSLIDRGLQILLAPSDRSMNSYGGRPARAAILAIEAEQIGYPDMQSVIYRVLATRATADVNSFSSPVQALECNMMMALYLALIDPDNAKQVLQAIEPHSDCIGSGYSGVQRYEWLKAWALVDPRHTMEVIERDLTSAKDSAAKQDSQGGLAEVVELWLTAPGDRLKNISERYRHMFPPVEEN